MSYSRRHFLSASAAAASAATIAFIPGRLAGLPESQFGSPAGWDDSDRRVLVQRGVDAAMGAGASYVDVRLTHDRDRVFPGGRHVIDTEVLTAGVRALVDGYWGFASGPLWTFDEMTRLGREAAAQAQAGALGISRTLHVASRPVVAPAEWRMPVQYDPFSVPLAEVFDFRESLDIYTARIPGARVMGQVTQFRKQQKAFGASDGSYCAQELFTSSGKLELSLGNINDRSQPLQNGSLDCLTPAGLGWELYRGQSLREAIDHCLEELRFDASLPVQPIDVGRFDIVLDAWSVAQVLNATIGAATELDRILGYESNAGGTSYINDPVADLGTLTLGSPLLTVTANRSDPGGAATVQWDDEGVVPDAFTIVDRGKLCDLSTTREGAGWLQEQLGVKYRMGSHGCAYAWSGLELPITYTPNLVMTSGANTENFDTLVAGMKSGIAFRYMRFNMDFQQGNGLGFGKAYEVRNGKRVALLANAGVLFRAQELWKSLQMPGGAGSLRRFGLQNWKGEPPQQSTRSITAVPAVFSDATVVDIMRKA